jgi:hypothetical protein
LKVNFITTGVPPAKPGNRHPPRRGATGLIGCEYNRLRVTPRTAVTSLAAALIN